MDLHVLIPELETLTNQEVLAKAHSLTEKNFGKTLTAFIPSPHFPSVSITGNSCSLNCSHCDRHYLEHMPSMIKPEDLYDFALKHSRNDGVGFLISGGFTREGKLPIIPYLPIIKKIKQETDLLIEIHAGLVSKSEAERLASAEIDIACVDIIGDKDTIETVYKIQATPQDYQQTVMNLVEANIPTVAPHITIGLHYGEIRGEWNALKMLQAIDISSLIFLILIPTSNTPMATVTPPSPKEVGTVIAASRILFPQLNIALGCMRPTDDSRLEYDTQAVYAGINRLVTPRNNIRERLLAQGYNISDSPSCCAISLIQKKDLI